MNLRFWPHKKTLSAKLISLFMLVAIFSSFITSFGLSMYEVNRAEEAQYARLHSIADILAPNVTASLLFQDFDAANELIEPLKLQPGIVSVTVLDTKGIPFTAIVVEEKRNKLGDKKLKQISVPLEVDGIHYGNLAIVADNSQFVEQVTFYVSFLLSVLLFIIIVSFLTSIILSSKFVEPILSLAELAKQVTSSRDYTLRAEQKSQDELGDLSTYLNSMLETIELRDQNLEMQVQQRTTELKVANEKLHTQAYNDSLSGLPNRRYLLELLTQIIESSKMYPSTFALLFLDLDGFKEVNDTLGHDAGDLLITAAASRLQEVVGDRAMVARLGGDEFTVLVRGSNSIDMVQQLAEAICRQLKKPFVVQNEVVHVSASIGISCYPESAETVDGILKNADMAMYEAKDAGRDCYRFFEPSMQEKILTRRRMMEDLRMALVRDELELYYQPIVNLANGHIDKAEALIRWNHPVKGVIPPEVFIQAAEENGLINELGCWVAEHAIQYALRLKENNVSGTTISINVSPSQFRPGSSWLERFLSGIENAKLHSDALSIEITENMLMSCDLDSLDKLMSIKEKGIEIAIDDFGVGYSSLSYLQQLSIDLIKIDRSFVSRLSDDFASATLCKTMINMAKNLEIKVVAEGIENDFQLEHLTNFGCHYGQGYYFAKPLNGEELITLISSSEEQKSKVSFHKRVFSTPWAISG